MPTDDGQPPAYGRMVSTTSALSGSDTGGSTEADEEGEAISPVSLGSVTAHNGWGSSARTSSSAYSSSRHIENSRRVSDFDWRRRDEGHCVIGVLAVPDGVVVVEEEEEFDEDDDDGSSGDGSVQQPEALLHRIFTIAVAGTGVRRFACACVGLKRGP